MKRIPIDAAMIAQLKALQGNTPLYRFAKVLGLSMPTVATALSGSNVHPGTRALLTMKLQELLGDCAQKGAAA